MASHIIDSSFFGDSFGTQEMRMIFTDEALFQSWLDVEVALAHAEAELGIVSLDVAKEIARKANFSLLDSQFIKEQIQLTVHPLVPLVRALKAVCEGEAGEYVHWGATTQDIMDTGLILQLRSVHAIISRDLEELEEIMLGLVREHKNTIMTGRTHGQHALPTTFGFKVAVWISELRRHKERLRESRERLLVGQMSGAVGTLASLGDLGESVQELTMKRLGLKVPDITWHSSRDRLAEFMNILAMLTTTAAKIANEIATLQKTECAELEEPNPPGKVGSSTMPHKRNPMVCEGIVAVSRIICANYSLSLSGMIHEHERDMRGWQTEWECIPEICIMSGAVTRALKQVLRGLTVHADTMKSNLTMTGGLIASEAVMLKLGAKIGRQEAHDLVYQAAMTAFEQSRPFRECLLESALIRETLSDADLDSVLDVSSYLGLAVRTCERMLQNS